MIIVAGKFSIDSTRRAEFIEQRRPAMERSRAENGCLTYVFSPDPLDDQVVHLFERWESKECLADHLEANRRAPRVADPVPVLASEIRQYEISAVGDVGS